MNSINSISPRALNDMIRSGSQVHLIDVRTPAEYRSGHAFGAISMPLDELNPDSLNKRLGDTPAGRVSPLFLTCQSGLRAEQAAERLHNAGFDKLYLVDGGTEAWRKAGLPMQRCGRAISVERQVQITIGVLFFAAIPLVGAGLILAGMTRWCGMARLVAMMPWNRGTDCSKQVTV